MGKRYNPPPNWPVPPAGWEPPAGWQPDPTWGPPPAGWQVWSEETTTRGMGKGAKIGLGVVAGVVALCSIGVVGAALGGGSDPARVVSADETTSGSSQAPESESAEEKAAAAKAEEEKAAADKAAEDKAAADQAAAEKAAADKAAADQAAEEKAAADKAAADAAAEAAKGTLSQQNATAKAADYLEYTAFSRSGLIGQLEFEGFSTEDATFAVDKLNPDWNAQAAAKAKDYLEYTSFSRAGLVDQLEFEGFTAEQAEFGAASTGL